MHSGFVRLPPLLTFVALSCLAAAIPTLIVLVRTAAIRRHRAYVLLAIGAAVAASTVAVPMIAAVVSPELVRDRVQRLDLATGLAVAGGLAAAMLTTGLLLLPGVARCGRIRARRILDGVMISASTFFAGWVVIVVPDQPLLARASQVYPQATVPVAIALTVAGIAIQSAQLASRPRAGTTVVAVGTIATVGGGAALTAGLCYGIGWMLAIAGSTVCLGLAAIAAGAAIGARATARSRPRIGMDSAHTSVLIPTFAVTAIGLSSLYALTKGPLDSVSVVVGIVDGLALLARLTLTVFELRQANERLEASEAHFRELAHTDPLTGLANRRGLLREMHEQVVKRPICVLMAMDLDGFKNVNDMRGHDVGDGVLIEVGERLRGNLRPGDMAARLGGDEFAVLMWARPDEAQRAAHRLLDLVSRPYEQAKGTVFLSASVGLAECGSADTVPMLLRNADLALRYAKLRGKARVEFYEPSYDVTLRRKTTIEHELRGAIDRDELYLAFQPVVAVPSARPVGAEALLRWRHPELGAVTPGEFIPIAEEAGLIGRLGTWVLHQACHQLSVWLLDGHDVWVAVNVSVRELHSPAFVGQVADVLRAHRVPAQRLVLEVTEQDVAMDVEEMAERLAALRSTGVRIALDDFGAGYSSLGQLHRLPVDILKIDRGLLLAPQQGAQSTAPLVEAAVTLGNRLGLMVIGEGVENQEQFELLKKVDCRHAQGNLLGQAMPAEHVEAMLAAAVPMPRRAQNMGQVDSGREMRQS